MLGVKLETLTCGGWKWQSWLRGNCVRHPTRGGRCNIYPIDQIQRIIEARAAAAGPQIPQGFVDRDGACRIMGVSRSVWKNWTRQGKVRLGQIIPSPSGGRQKIYAIADLKRLKDELFGADKLYKGADQHWRVPAGFVRREEAWAKFGVSQPTWERWEREGKITCGSRVPGGPKLYKVEDINRLLDEHGRYAPPYPDPDRPGVYRVPLSGHDIRRREAIIDADSLPLIEGGTCHLAASGDGTFVSFWAPEGRVHLPLRRVILGVGDRNLQIGHVNGDPLDCRRENLVVRTVAQRCYTQRKRTMIAGRRPTSQFKGVSWETWTQRWRAGIKKDGKMYRLGRYRDEIAAAEAYDEAARQLFGQHARLNFPDGVDAWLVGAGAAAATAAAA
jgi:hypothetical protein